MAIRKENHDDLGLFKNRLWHLMESKGIDTPKVLAEELYTKGLVSVKTRENFNESHRDRQNAIGSITKKIVKHLRSDMPNTLQGEFVLAYCIFFECSSDYLFGLTELKTNDMDIRKICDKTGLSEKAVQKLVGNGQIGEMYKFMYIKYWSVILESDLFETIPYDWQHLIMEKCKYVENKYKIEAYRWLNENEKLEKTLFFLQEGKIKTLENSLDSHYAAVYGFLNKMSRNFTNLVEMATDELCPSKEEMREKYYDREIELIMRYNNKFEEIN